MTPEERELLIKTAQALGSMSNMLAQGCGMQDFEDLSRQINELRSSG